MNLFPNQPLSDMYPLYWTTSKEGILFVIVMNLKELLLMKLDSEKLYEKFKRIYDESVIRNVDKVKVEDRLWNRGRGR